MAFKTLTIKESIYKKLLLMKRKDDKRKYIQKIIINEKKR